jgi:hypothetical protein
MALMEKRVERLLNQAFPDVDRLTFGNLGDALSRDPSNERLAALIVYKKYRGKHEPSPVFGDDAFMAQEQGISPEALEIYRSL